METNFMLKRPPSLRAFWKLFIWLLVALPMLFGGTVWGQTNTELQLAFSKAYEKYPQIPKGLLETVSFHNTKLTHITGSSDHHEMPDVYGVMGLYDNSNLFVNTLEKVSVSSTFDKQELINSLDANILGTAMYLLELAKTHNSLNYKDYSIWRKVLESFSAVEGTDEISKFIRLEYAHRVLVSMREGVIYNGLVIEPNANILVENIFSKSDVDILNGEKLRIDITNGRVEGVDYFNAEWSPSPNYNSRGGTKITDVAIHVAEGGLTSALRTLTDPNRTARVSSHYLVSSTGRVLQLVLEANNAWHIGNGNSYTVGIEHEGFVADPNKWFTTQMYQASADLVKNICQRNGIDPKTCYRGTSNSALVDGANYHVKGHTHFPKSVNSNGHTDPGTGWNWNNYYNLINGSNCTGTTLNLTAMSMISQRGSTTDMTYKENATFNATIKNISNCTVTKVIGFVPVDPSGSQKGLLYPQTITLTAGSIKTISQPDLIQGAIGNGWKMYVVANDTEAAIQASLLNGVSNFKYPIASGGASNPYSYNVIAAPAIVSCAKPTALIGALYNGGSVQDLQIPSGSTLRTIANGTTSTSCPIASAVIYVRENGGQWNNVSVTLPFDKTNVLSNNTNISKQVEIYIRVTNSAGYTDSNILRYTILPVQTTTNPTPVPTVCQSAPTVNISNPNQTVYVDDVVNINYTVAAGTNCFVQQVNFVNTTTGQTSIGTNTSFQTNFLQAGIYQYKIEAINGYTSSFSGGTITVNPKPLLCVAPTVTLGSPANGMDYGVNSGLALFYQGTSSTQCPILEYQFNISHNGTRIVNGLPPNQPNSYVLSNMLAGTYQWEVRARNQAGWGNWSGQKSFTVTDFSATLSAPTVSVSNSGCIGSQISVDASAVPNATRYEFLIADNANMSNAQVRAANLGYYSYLFKPEEFGWGKTWYFKAKAYSANNVASPLSNTVSTTTMPDKPLVSVSQNNFNIVAGQTVMLSASGSGNLEWYNAEYGGNLLSSGNTYLVSPTANTDYWVRQSILTPTSTKCYSYSTKVSVNVTSATLSVTPSNQNLSSASGSFVANVQTNANFVVTSNASWLSISGQNSTGFTANYTANTSSVNRNAVITITGGGLTRTINVSQSAPLIVTVSTNTLNVGNTANSQTMLNVLANTNWAVSNVPADLSITPASGTGNATLTVKVNTQNPTATMRSFTFALAGNTVMVMQAGTPVVVTPPAPVATIAQVLYTNTDPSGFAGISNVVLHNNKFMYIVGTDFYDEPSYPDAGVKYGKLRLMGDNVEVSLLESNKGAIGEMHGTDIKLTPDGKLGITYRNWAGFSYAFNGLYKIWDGTAISTSENHFTNANVGIYNRLHYGTNQQPQIASFSAAGYYFTHSDKSSGTWNTGTSNFLGGWIANYASLTIGDNWYVSAHVNTQQKLFTKLGSAAWQVSDLATGLTNNCDLKANAANEIHSLYVEGNNLKLQKIGGTAEIVVTSDSLDHRATLYFDNAGVPYVAYMKGKTGIKVLKKVSGTWTEVYAHTSGLKYTNYYASSRQPSLLMKGADLYVVYNDNFKVYAYNLTGTPVVVTPPSGSTAFTSVTFPSTDPKESIGYKIIKTTDGNLLVAGVKDYQWEPTSGVVSSSYGIPFFKKLSPNGSQVWEKTYGTGTGFQDFKDVIQLSDGSLLGAGKCVGCGAGRWSGYIVKTDANGNKLWEKTNVGGSDWTEIIGLTETADGGFVAVGGTTDTDAWLDVFLAKFDAAGNQQWIKYYGRALHDYGFKALVTSDGGYMISGQSGIHTSQNFIWLVKTDASGNKVWDKTFGGLGCGNACGSEQGYSMVKMPDNTYVIAGNRYIDASKKQETVLLKIDESGNQIWEKTFGDPNLTDYGLTTLNVLSNGGFLFSGNTEISSNNYATYVITTDANGNLVKKEDISTGSTLSWSVVSLNGNDQWGLVGGIKPTGNNTWDLWYVTNSGATPTATPDLTTGLVVHLPLDSNPQDISGSNNHGTVFGTPAYAQGKIGDGMQFFNVNHTSWYDVKDYIKLPNATYQNTFTLSHWVSYNSNAGYQGHPASSLSIGAVNETADFNYRNDSLVYSFRNTNTNLYYKTTITKNQMSLLTMVVTPTLVKFYKDGVLVDSQVINFSFNFTNATQDVALCRWWTSLSSSRFNGIIDDVRIYNRALTDAEVQALYNAPAPTPSTPAVVTLSAPASLTATAVSASQINLAWANANTNNVSNIQVERATGNGTYSFVTALLPTATSYNATALSAGTLYSFRIRNVGANNAASPFVSASASTQVAPTAPTGSDPFGNATATNISHTVFVPANLTGIANGDVLGLGFMSNGQWVLSNKITFSGVNDAINAYGDDTDTANKDGFASSENFIWKLWKAIENKVYDLTASYSAPDATFTHQGAFAENGISGLASFAVVPSNPDVTQTILIKKGVNYIGLFVKPNDPKMEIIWASQSSKLSYVKNLAGKVYLPSKSFNQIGNWVDGEGYIVLANTDFTLTVTGKRIDSNIALSLKAGWNLVAYTQQGSQTAVNALAGIKNNLILAKNESGLIYSEKPFFINKIGDFSVGKAYMIKLTVASNLTYPQVPYGNATSGGNTGRAEVETFANLTDNNASVLIPLQMLKNEGITNGSRIQAISSEGKLVGESIFTGENVGLSIYGQDEQNFGLRENETFHLQIADNQGKIRSTEITFDQANVYQANGIFIATKMAVSSFAYSFGLSVYPNPTSERANFDISLSKDVEINLEIFNAIGQKVHSINQYFTKGEHHLEFNAEGLANGLLMYRLRANDEVRSGSLLLQK